LDLKDKARRAIEDGIERLAYAPALWELHAEMMIEARQWHELQMLAMKMRDDRLLSETLSGYSHYLEGRAQLGQSRPNDALESFKTALSRDYPSIEHALDVAGKLTSLGYASLVREFLVRQEPRGKTSVDYWQAVYKSAFALRDENLLLKSASCAYELNPHNVIAMNNYAAALLSLRRQPDEAIKITRQLAVDFPNSVAMAYNHALALLLNMRTDEAESLLKSIAPEQVGFQDFPEYRLAWLELQFQKKQWEGARKTAAQVQTNSLFTPQRLWFEHALAALHSNESGNR
jgi:tetratricopeptide (TPR) repeat protein